MLAALGAAGTVAGMGLNAWGQNQAISAMRDVWGNARAQQAGYDQAINARQQQALAEVNPASVLGLEQAQQTQGQMDGTARAALAAIQAQAGRRKGNAEGKAATRQRQGGTLADLLRSGRAQAMLRGINAGGQNLNRTAQGLSLDQSVIRGDARAQASLTPMFERAAAMKGAFLRQAGTALQGLGGMGMNMGMSQPMPGAPTSTLDGLPYAQAGMTEAPTSGWAARNPYLG